MSTLTLKELSAPTGEVIKIAAGKTLDLHSQGTTKMPTGSVIQTVNALSTSMISGTTTVPIDDTIPQITEGFEVMTLNITPTSATNKLWINIVTHISASVNAIPTSSLFVGTTANALATCYTHAYGAADHPLNHKLIHYMTSGSTSELTFRVRVGMNNSGTTTFNGRSGSRKMGGAITSTITIMEIQV